LQRAPGSADDVMDITDMVGATEIAEMDHRVVVVDAGATYASPF
jgi:hypothetical protein